MNREGGSMRSVSADTDSSANTGRCTQRWSKVYNAPQYKILRPEEAAAAIQSITRVLERVGAEMDRRGLMSGTTDISLSLYAARELERYLCGEKTEICNRRMEEVYYRVLCSGIKQLQWLDQDLTG